MCVFCFKELLGLSVCWFAIFLVFLWFFNGFLMFSSFFGGILGFPRF